MALVLIHQVQNGRCWMPSATLKKIITQVAGAKRASSRNYQLMEALVEDPEAKIFLDHMARQEIVHAEKVESFSDSFRYDEPLPGIHTSELLITMPPTLNLGANTSADEVIDYALDIHRELWKTYNRLSRAMESLGRDKSRRFLNAMTCIEFAHYLELECLKSNWPRRQRMESHYQQ